MKVAALIMVAWLISVLTCLPCDLNVLAWWKLIIGVVIRTELQTGLFIIGHDAMHQVLWPEHPRWNDRLGALALALYAALPYQLCGDNHRLHHRFAATALDPDFCRGSQDHAANWYCQFMTGYLSASQMIGLLMLWTALFWVSSLSTSTAFANMLIFFALPLLLSSLQLFVFGTYLPHRRQRGGTQGEGPESLDLPSWLSLLTCFHFGYHREHHDNPGLAWFELPRAKKCNQPLPVTWDAM
jgi:beta-carotene ketolase (CrtW type)